MRTIILAFAACAAALAQPGPARVASPDGRAVFELVPGNRPAYRVLWRGKVVIADSALGLETQGQPPLGPGLALTSVKTGQADETYRTPHGKSNPVRNRYNSLTAEFAGGENRAHRRLAIEARAYDDGVAFRYIIPEQPNLRELRVASELTEFQFAKDADTYPLFLNGYRTSYEDSYHHLVLSGIHPSSLIAVPFLAEVPGVAWVAITEAHLENWAGLYLAHSRRNARTLEARLAPRVDDPSLAVSGATPIESPWRVFLLGDEPGRLVESNLVLNLNPPSAIADTSWIRPGKTAWDWWSGSIAKNVSFQPGMNTATMNHYIDFASDAKLEYMLIDAGWAAPGQPPDITRTIPAIDIPEIVRHAASRSVKVWLWSHWTSVDRYMDEAFPLFEKWGIAGVKIDFMDRDDQWMVDWYHRVLKKAAEHHLMIDYHGAYKPDGMRRTWPNLMTSEGVMGLEYLKWSARITPEHNVMLAFTRMLAGPMDYTPGGFGNTTKADFVPRNREPMVMGTRAHQLALYAIFESPLQMLADHPEAYRGQPELPFLSAVPATWDETRVLGGRPGEYITVARRSAKDWYIGSITNWNERELNIPLEFLGSGKFTAEIYADAPDAAANPTRTAIETRPVDRASVLRAKLAPGGGCAVRIRPAAAK